MPEKQAAPGDKLEETIHGSIQTPRTRAAITNGFQEGTVAEFSHGRAEVAYIARFNSFGNHILTEDLSAAIDTDPAELILACYFSFPFGRTESFAEAGILS
jgi:hypothetical protein